MDLRAPVLQLDLALRILASEPEVKVRVLPAEQVSFPDHASRACDVREHAVAVLLSAAVAAVGVVVLGSVEGEAAEAAAFGVVPGQDGGGVVVDGHVGGEVRAVG